MVNFKNTIIIMTSNIGSQHIVDSAGKDYETIKKTVLGEMRNYFRPEFLNRVDEIVMFHGLSQDDILSIVDIQLRRFAELLTARNIDFSADKKAKTFLAQTGFDPVYGARPLKRAIQRELETPVSRLLVSGELKEGQSIKVSAEDEKLEFKVTK
jgi:ATP-dependent Clp protease ATP-binding subunit ClpB